MGFETERAVNAHFAPFYGHVAEELLAEGGGGWLPPDGGRALEIGPYGPGVSLALAERRSGLSFVCGDDRDEAVAYLAEQVAEEGMAERIRVQRFDKRALPFGEGSFDLVLFRGGLFFWEGQARILAEMDRVLRPGGLGAHGGGFGAGAADALIEERLPRARELNDLLGKSRLAPAEAEAHAAEAGIAGRARIARRHGLWIFWSKG
ncbi:MAG: class I SAM-dependent methyltransferase [bacterium]